MDEKDKVLKQKLTKVWGYFLNCPDCGEKHFTSAIWRDMVKPWIEYTKREGNTHPLDQIDRDSELAYIKCQECGVKVDFRLPFFLDRYQFSKKVSISRLHTPDDRTGFTQKIFSPS